MLTDTSAAEDCSLRSVAVTDARIGEEATPERRREFDNILSHALPRFRRIAMRWLRNPEDAEDAVQDAMLSAFTHIARFDGRAKMSTWVMAIVINAIRMQIRRRPRRQMLSLDQRVAQGQWTISEILADPRPSPEQTLEQRELRAIVIKLTGSLRPAQRAALQLRLRDDLSIQKAAQTLGVPEGTVKAQLARGRARLMQRFHDATRRPQTATPGLDSNARRKASSSEYRLDRAQDIGRPPIAVFVEQGGCEGWVSA
jgi:RNA polymerase sigma-70 factor, ECF subfamily